MNTTDEKLFVFWKHDMYPYCLGGEVVSKIAENRFHVKGYEGYSIKPFFICTVEEGKALLNVLESLAAERTKAIKEIVSMYDSALIDVQVRLPIPRVEIIKKYDK